MSKYTAFTPNCFDAFGLGGLYPWCRLNPDRLTAFKKKFKIALIGALAIYFIWKLCPYFGVFPKYSFFGRTIDSIISVGLIDLVINNKNKWVKTYILENKFLNGIGKISYRLYLFHYPFSALFAKYMLKIPALNIILNRYSYLYLPVMLALLLVIAFLSFELFEKQITSLKGDLNMWKIIRYGGFNKR